MGPSNLLAITDTQKIHKNKNTFYIQNVQKTVGDIYFTFQGNIEAFGVWSITFPPFRATGTLGCGLSTLVGSSGRYLGVVLVRFTLARPEHAVANAAITDKYDCRQEHDGTDSAWLPFQEEPDQV